MNDPNGIAAVPAAGMDLPSTIHFLGELLGQVIGEVESRDIYEIEERIRADAKELRARDTGAGPRLTFEVAALSPCEARAVASAFTLYFDLVNLAEEAQRVHALRDRERARYPSRTDESIAQAIAT